MTRIQQDRLVHAPRTVVWDILADLGGVARFHPGVKASRYLSDARTGIGARRRCELKPGGVMDEEVVAWRDGESFTVELVASQGVPPFRTARGTFELEEEDAGATRVTLRMEYQMGLGPVGALLDRLMVRPKFTRMTGGILHGLARFAERGAPDRSGHRA